MKSLSPVLKPSLLFSGACYKAMTIKAIFSMPCGIFPQLKKAAGSNPCRLLIPNIAGLKPYRLIELQVVEVNMAPDIDPLDRFSF